MAEAVRLVIWDLDETFWRGTLTEGGIREFVQEHHDIVIELARRGIVSAICSKNDEATVLKILEEQGLREYFVFPSISWEPKGMRIATMIEAIGLRPPTVLFIDDNPNNLAEAQAVVPGLQVADETFTQAMLADPRFRGKDDRALTRLKQYQLLEQKKQDELKAGGDNSGFLRSCDVRVFIDFDIESNIDRAVELINRTNQLNFTKQRLPEDPERARRMLLRQIKSFRAQAGLVRVRDRYGDYGYIGFYLVQTSREEGASRRLEHFCFSCRTLGMLVEKWVYQWLGSPALTVVGEVLTDLWSGREIDWIRQVTSLDEDRAAVPAIAPAVRVHGGCEAQAVGHYLSAHAPDVAITGNFAAGALFVRQNGATVLMAAADSAPGVVAAEMAPLGVPPDRIATDYFAAAPPGTLYVFGGGMDARLGRRYRHREHGLEVRVEVGAAPATNMAKLTPRERERLAKLDLNDAGRAQVAAAIAHLEAHYTMVQDEDHRPLEPVMRRLFDRIPAGSKLIIVLDDERIRFRDGVLQTQPSVRQYNAWLAGLVADLPWVGIADFAAHINSEDEIQVGGNHYDRMVYFRLAQQIVALAGDLPAKHQALLAAE